MEFHVSRQARDRYQFDQALFSLSGNVIFANFHAARLFAQKINQKRDLLHFPERAIKAGQINALGLIDEILHHVIALYRQQKNPQAMRQALAWIENEVGSEALNKVMGVFTAEFPPLAVYRRELSAEVYLQTDTNGVPNREIVLEEMLLLWVTNKNPACDAYQELFNDETLRVETAYFKVLRALYEYFETQPKFGPEQQNLVDMLRSPALKVPNSLFGQLEYIRERWSELLGRYLYRLLTSLDLIREEDKSALFGFGGGGPGPVLIPVYDQQSASLLQAENYSPDREWMPRLVVLAKNTYVWLDQLGKQYQRTITRLDQIPDEELDQLAQRGFTGLWLIGLWERSKASARVKQLCGNPDAVASAYSLASYQIAEEIGGEAAYQNLRERAWQRGIRLASDMVPNHMGIDSDWVIDHPERFVSLPYSPFPSYTFNGPDLAPDGRVSLYLEDHYYNRSDAAVVFKRVDHRNGSEQYIYHGNDGTSMPWNDTAQLNYLNPEVREAIIQTILDVARRFPIIRFDAAMTLAKKHYQRLWYPEPGTGGDIASRAEHSMTREQFDALMPQEFWREVVERVAQEVPDTLLLAEAFWLMESYFVRTLGMHRVYNSAFMNLLRNEDNAKYRLLMKNTLEFDPEILKRFVNFMNNPDERTAVDQFGKGDKYFGICLLMATLPGLPMFGHGQVEGFAEKYGMEYHRAYWDEQIDSSLVERHQREIFPLLHRRALFANVDDFLLYDFFTEHAGVNEDVYAYSNGLGGERALVVYHNRYGSTSGWVRTSVGYSVKQADGSRSLTQRTLGEGLNLHNEANTYTLFRDSITGLENIRPSQQICEQGLFLELGAYRYHAFVDFREVQDDEWHSYHQLCEYLGGRGVPSIQEALQELLLRPVLQPFRQIINAGYFHYLLKNRLDEQKPGVPPALLDEAAQKMTDLLQGMQSLTNSPAAQSRALVKETRQRLEALLSMPRIPERFSLPGSTLYPQAIEYLLDGLNEQRWTTLLSFLFVHNLGKLADAEGFESQTLSWLEEWQLGKVLMENAQHMGSDPAAAARMVGTVKLLINQQRWFDQLRQKPLQQILEGWLASADVQQFLGVNRYKDILWFNQQAFEEFIWWMMALEAVQATADPQVTTSLFVERALTGFEIVRKLQQAADGAGYQIARLLEAASED